MYDVLLFYSAQRTPLEEMMVFNHRKCLTWFHKYTNNLSDTLGIYKCTFKKLINLYFNDLCKI